MHGRPALAEIVRRYWQPLYSFARRRGYSSEDAEDATQEFLSNVISGHLLESADPAKGKFRAFLLTAWKRLFFEHNKYVPNPKMSKQWNRGAFLATGPTHCVTCHSPKNLLGGMDYDHQLNGDANGLNGEKIPAITATALRKNGWTKKAIVFALKTGSKPDGDVFGSGMGEVVRESTRFLTDEDLNAIAEYVMSIEHKNGKSIVKNSQ